MENNPPQTPSGKPEPALSKALNSILGPAPDYAKAPTVVSVASKPEDSQRLFDEMVSSNPAPEWRVSIRRVSPYRWPENEGTRLTVGEVARWPVERIGMLERKIIDVFGGGRYKLILHDSCGNLCCTAELVIPTETFAPKDASIGLPRGATVVAPTVIPSNRQYPASDLPKKAFRPFSELQASLALDQVIRQNERLIAALIETNRNLMGMCERLVKGGLPDALDPFDEIDRLRAEAEELQSQAVRDPQARKKEKRGSKHDRE